jgi:hypothetical protein
MALISVTISGNAAPLKKSVDESEGLLGRLGGSFTKFGAIAAAGMGAAAAGIGFAAKAAADDEKSFEQLAVTLRNVTGATDEMIRAVDDQLGAMSLATGVADDKLRPAFEALARGTKDTEEAMSRMNLVLDISQALQVDQTTVADALAKAYQGNFRALQALAPEMKTLIADGIDAEGAMSILADTFGGSAAAAADTFSGQIDRLKVFFSELVEQVGYYVLPVLSKIAEFIVKDVVPAFQRIVDKYGPALAEIFGKIADFIGDKVVPVIRDRLLPFIEEVARFIGEKLVPVIRDVAIKVFDGLRSIFEKVSDKIEDNRDNISKLVEFFRTLAEFVATKVAPVLVTVLGKAFDIVSAAIGPVIDVVFSLMGAFATFGTFLVKVAGFVLDTIEKMVNFVIGGINKAIDAANKLNPFADIPNVPEVSFGTIGGTAPSAPSRMGDSGPDRVERMGATTPTIPTFTIPGLGGGDEEDGGGGGGGGGRRAVARPVPVDMSGFIGISPSTIISGGGGGGTGAAMGTEALLDGLTGGVNIVVNTVSADANLPNLIVEALQQYNLTSGPIDVAIAV